jgi:hypothetical protein
MLVLLTSPAGALSPARIHARHALLCAARVQAVHLGPSEPEPLYINGAYVGDDSIDHLSSNVDWESEHQRRRQRRRTRRLRKEARAPNPLLERFGFAIPPPPADLVRRCKEQRDEQSVWGDARQEFYEERARRRERAREREQSGRAPTPALRVASPEIGRVARNHALASSGLKVVAVVGDAASCACT